MKNLLSALGQIWFPLALIALVILTLPAMILLIMNFLGEEGEFNDWLLQNFQISYAPPLILALILMLIIPAIILVYFLKLKRKPLQVPSPFLWKYSIEVVQQNSLFHWRRENVLSLRQPLTLWGLVSAIVGCRYHGN